MQIRAFKEFVGFSNESETLPKFFDDFDTKIKLRQLFLKLTTSIVDGAYSFTNNEICHWTKYPLHKIFQFKIESMMPVSNIKPYKQPTSFTPDIVSTKIINNYINKENNQELFYGKQLLPLARLIAFCFINNKMQLYFDINLLFHQFVFNKVKNLHKDKKVIDSGDSICIMNHNSAPVKIYTSWKSINEKQLNIKDELKNAIECIKQSEFKQVYLVYPKAQNFKKHIPVRVKELEDTFYDIKVIPYSLRSTLRKLK